MQGAVGRGRMPVVVECALDRNMQLANGTDDCPSGSQNGQDHSHCDKIGVGFQQLHWYSSAVPGGTPTAKSK